MEPQCLDGFSTQKPLIAFYCGGGNQYWLMNKEGAIFRDDLCFDYPGGEGQLGQKDKIILWRCNLWKTQKWAFQDGLLKHADSGACIELAQDKRNLIMAKCNQTNTAQLWSWKKRE